VARKMIVDTGVLIQAERGKLDLSNSIAPDDDVAIAAVTLAELFEGVEAASGPRYRERLEFVNAVSRDFIVEEYGALEARVHARLLAFTRRKGLRRGAHDLFVAATAIKSGRTIVTTDAKASFSELPEVDYIVLSQP
jgi:tRNA(fMet)-specific endonuclease VapC